MEYLFKHGTFGAIVGCTDGNKKSYCTGCENNIYFPLCLKIKETEIARTSNLAEIMRYD